MPEALGQLRPASYNPRTISTRQREALQKSYVEYGDLSGIVRNLTTGNLVGGHQRVDIFKTRRAFVTKHAHRDVTGTVAEGYAIVPHSGGGTFRIPYREVRWGREREMSANIAANAAGGEFDDVKLGKVLAQLERRNFAVESTTLDALSVKRAMRAFEQEQSRSGGDDHGHEHDGSRDAFATLDPAVLKAAAEHCCPSCGYLWNGETKPSFGNTKNFSADHPVVRMKKTLEASVRKRMARTGETAKEAALGVAAERERLILAGRLPGAVHRTPASPARGRRDEQPSRSRAAAAQRHAEPRPRRGRGTA